MMNSQILKNAREYEAAAEKEIKDSQRPAFHFSPRTGWTNDPNGFSWYGGAYHLFYQYNPYHTNWDKMHWGHAVSKDLLHWEYLPAAMAPDETYDETGCFSGSASALPDGRQLIMYTGVSRKMDEHGKSKDIQTQCIAVGDGTDYEKYKGNPVLTGKDLPKGSSEADFRDPKIWQGKDGRFYCVVGSRDADGSGQILVFSSGDGFQWQFESILAKNERRFGSMWECPDFFELDGKHVLIVSPQDMAARELEFGNGNVTLCLIGELEENRHVLKEQYAQAIDYGIDFYAPQTLLSPDGRRIMIGWMQNWDTCLLRLPEQKWFGQMSIPRELSVKDGRLYQKPVRELENLRRNPVSYTDVALGGEELELESVFGRTADIELELIPEPECKKITVNFAKDSLYKTSLVYDIEKSVVELDRTFSGVKKAALHRKACKVRSENGRLQVRMILDRFSVEIFINGGEQVMSMALYTELSADKVTFSAQQGARMNLVKYELLSERNV